MAKACKAASRPGRWKSASSRSNSRSLQRPGRSNAGGVVPVTMGIGSGCQLVTADSTCTERVSFICHGVPFE
jgi:hypothetical protein